MPGQSRNPDAVVSALKHELKALAKKRQEANDNYETVKKKSKVLRSCFVFETS